jgi:hypothetical protein
MVTYISASLTFNNVSATPQLLQYLQFQTYLDLDNFSNLFLSITCNHLSFSFKYKLRPSQHGFVKSKSTVTNLIT